MKRIFLISVVLSAFTLFPLFAQQNGNTDEIKKQINKIKKNNQYIYAESTAPTETDARNYAEEKLYEEINVWVETRRKLKKSSNLVVNNKKELWTILEMPRGSNMFRSFIYVKKMIFSSRKLYSDCKHEYSCGRRKNKRRASGSHK